MVPFLQFKKSEKHPWRSVTFDFLRLQPATLLKVALLHGCFSRFFLIVNTVGRGVLTHLFYEVTPYISYPPPFFSNSVH